MEHENVRMLVTIYLTIFLKEQFIVEDLAGWDAPVKSRSRVRTKPKRYFADPSLPASLLGMNEERILSEMQIFGLLFEELCIRDLRVYASAMDLALPEPVRYYRDSDGLEVDAVIELRDGRWGAIEIKLSEAKVDEGVANLMRLKQKLSANPKATVKEPSFMAVIVGKTDFCRKSAEGVYIFPVTSFTA
jgi:predicted AAA+ superfamily ATPase